MRHPYLHPRRPSSSLAASLLLLAVFAGAATAQETPAPGEAKAPPAAPAPTRPPEPLLAIVGATIHPVSGNDVPDGVVLVRGERIVGVGSRQDVTVPPEAKVLTFAGGHVYPGLVDALTDAFTDAAMRGDGSLDAGLAQKDGLRQRGDREDALVQQGITTAFVGNRGPAQFRGIGALVRPTADGFELFPGKEQAALQMRIAQGPGPSHALQRQQALEGIGGAFDGLDAYQKAFDEHQKAAAKYSKEFEEYLAYFRKKKEAEDKAKGIEPKPAEAARSDAGGQAPPGQPGPGARGRRGQSGPGSEGGGEGGDNGGRRGRRGGGPPAGDGGNPGPAPTPPASQSPAPAAPATTPPTPPAGDAKPSEDKPPARPTFPKAPAHDAAKDALQQVLAGTLPLRLEAHRPDEIRAALKLQKDKKVPTLVLEQAYGAADLARELADSGVACVLTEVLPGVLPKDYEDYDPTAVPAALARAGATFAIGSGSARLAGCLRLMAAVAIGQGLPEAAALRAITLSPAEILGVAKDTGSLEAGKLADLLVTDKPLFASDSRVLAVFGKGQSLYEVR